MPHNVNKTLFFLAILSCAFGPANVQYAVPMYAPPPVYAVPAPVPMPVPVAVAIQLPERTTTTKTTTTTPEPLGVAIAMPVPVAMPYAIPAPPPPVFCQARQRPNGCPPCPPCVCLPSCTPAFFSYCSPCHQRCRCRGAEDAPVPMPPPGPPYPVPMPAPAVGPAMIVPVPPVVRIPQYEHYSSSLSSDDTSDSSSSDTDFYRRRRRRRRRRFWRRKRRWPYYRRQLNAGDESEGSKSDLVKPVLSYVSENGDVIYENKIGKNDAKRMLGVSEQKYSNKNPKSINGDDSVIVSGKSNSNRRSGRRFDKVLLRNSETNHVLKEGNSKIIFKPPTNKEIKNVAVSFHVA